jgi:hypothetical protein
MDGWDTDFSFRYLISRPVSIVHRRDRKIKYLRRWPVSSKVEIARSLRHVNRMLTQRLEGHDLEGAFVRRGQDYEGRCSVVVSPEPVCGSNTPPVSGHQPRETVLKNRRAQVVADGPLVLEKLAGDYRTNCVTPEVLRPRRTTPITIEARHRVGTTRF